MEMKARREIAKMTGFSLAINGPCDLVEGPPWGDAEFYGRWLLAAAEAEALWKNAYSDFAFQKQVDRVCLAYIPHFGISATLIITELRQYKTSLIIALNTEEGESFAMMVAMGFYIFSAPHYQMTIPSHLTEVRVKQAVLNFIQTEDAEFMLHPEHLVSAISFTEARAWQDRICAIDGFRDNLSTSAGTLN
jgi:hypothetical protein